MPAGRSTALVHLVRYANGLDPFLRFMESYERHPAGLDHELVLLFKGFPDQAATAPYMRRAEGAYPRAVQLGDQGLDLTAYMAAAEMVVSDRICFVNSFSEILAPGWLSLLDSAMEDPSVGAAGATGSWASALSYSLFQLGLAGGYGETLPDRPTARKALHELAGVQSRGPALHWLWTLGMTAGRFPRMCLFPAVHLRTNAFLIDRSTFRSLRTGGLRSKQGAYYMESGRASMTAQLRRLGRPPVMVDRLGAVHAPAQWSRGNVFWQSAQQDLLVADNQTRSYAEATRPQRAVLSAYAWGWDARPSP